MSENTNHPNPTAPLPLTEKNSKIDFFGSWGGLLSVMFPKEIIPMFDLDVFELHITFTPKGK